jgi:hypothetical protein
MRMRPLGILLLWAAPAWAADHTITLTARQEQILADYIATETSDPKPTTEDVIRQSVHRFVQQQGTRQKEQQRGKFMDSTEGLTPAQRQQVESIVGVPLPQ